MTCEPCAAKRRIPRMEQTSPTISAKIAAGTLSFVKDLATYYMDFLETDFHRRRNPKRSVRFRSADNLLIGLSAGRYPAFVQHVWKLITSGFQIGTLSSVGKGSYRTTIPRPVLELIRLEIEKITEVQIAQLRAAISVNIVESSHANRGDYDKALTEAMEAVAGKVRAELVLPFVGRIKQPLERLDLGDENTLYLVEEELQDLLLEPARNKISELIRRLIVQQNVDVENELLFAFSAVPVQCGISTFFSNLAVGDLFAELYELERNRSILEKQEFYLYFGDIAYNGCKYPVFYIPFHVVLSNNEILMDFDSQAYVNKRALEYIVQEENQRTGKKGALRCTADRIIYLAQHAQRFPDVVTNVFSELTNFFQLNGTIDINDHVPQLAKGISVRVTNACYIALFDNSDEALLNDYEQMLQFLGQGPENPIAGAFIGLIDNFIHRNPESVSGEVEGEWDDLSVPDRLVNESPIPLNSEQRQILLALGKDRCKYITVEGPPGTGKSHTITAIVCNAVINHQSVLVLSDKKEALDVVEEKITSTLNKVRNDKKFQNPLLRLGKTGSTYAQILSVAVMEDIKAHYRAVKKQHDSVRQRIEQGCASLKEDIEAEALGYADIDLSAIREWALLDATYTDKNPIVDFTELLKCDGAADDLEDLRGLCTQLKSLQENGESGADVLQTLGFGDIRAFDDLVPLVRTAIELERVLTHIEQVFPGVAFDLELLGRCAAGDLPSLAAFVTKFSALKKPVIGYFFARRKVKDTDRQFKQQFGFASTAAPHTCLNGLARIVDVGRLLSNEINELQPTIRSDWFTLCQMLITRPHYRAMLRRIAALNVRMSAVPELARR
jgi:hypothetical protein